MRDGSHRVLLVEDNPGDALLIQEILREECGDQCTVEHVDRLGLGLEQVAQRGFDVVLLDLSLPDAHGLDTFTRLHAHAPDIPVVVLTGLDDDELARRALQAGAQDYLPKGEVNPHGLVRSMLYAMERSRGEAERRELLAREQAARAEAEADRARLQTILASTASGILYVDAASGQITANPAAERLLGHPLVAEDGTEQYVGQICHADGRALAHEELLTFRALRGETLTDVERLIRRPDGSQVPVLSSAAPVRDASGRIIGAVAVHQDITPLKELERLREEWTSVIAHDLRQPVAAITAYASALSAMAERQVSLDQVGSRLDNILLAAHQLGRMIADLLDASRLGAGRLKLEPIAIDVRVLIPAVVERAAELTLDRAVVVQMPAAVPRVTADPGRLEQVLVNLLSNAAKYGAPDTPIMLSVEPGAAEVEISVCNEGAGIPSEEIPRLFTRFYRTQGARTSDRPGLGLGLYVCRELVQAHGGRIWVDSTPGATTTFHFTLPLAPSR